MATYARKLKDGNGSYICPVTRSDLVYFPDNTVLSKLTFYPVGSIYQSFENTSPASLFGGSWEKIENTFLYASGMKSVGDSGGEETHTLSINEMPTHNHAGCEEIKRAVMYDSVVGFSIGIQSGSGVNTSLEYVGNWNTGSTGGSQSHNNMPPYEVVNIWKRTA